MVSMNSNPQIANQFASEQAVAVDPESAWEQLLARDRAASFFYAVTTTGVFCKPTAVAKNPMSRIRAHIEANLDRPVSLAELGRVAGLSPFTVQRLFKKEIGVSPLQYQRALRAGRLRTGLKQGGSVTDAIYEAGFGSSSRAYESAPLG